MKRIAIALLMVFTLLLQGCLYINVRTPYDQNLNNTNLGSKQGTASMHSVLWLVTWGDSSYAAAAKDGNIRVLKHADQEVQSYLFGIYSRRTVIVYGE
jgi:hypothetical protein